MRCRVPQARVADLELGLSRWVTCVPGVGGSSGAAGERGVTVRGEPGAGSSGRSCSSCARAGSGLCAGGEVHVAMSGSWQRSPDTSACSGPTRTPPAVLTPPVLAERVIVLIHRCPRCFS